MLPGVNVAPTSAALDRQALLRHVLRLEYVTVGWNVVEGVVAVAAGAAAGSIALLAFGIDSFVEMASGLILIWRVRAERRAPDPEPVERAERRARKGVAVSLFLLAVYVTWDSLWTLWRREVPDASPVGIVLLVISLWLMRWLARQKRRAAAVMGSRALAADSMQTTACWWLSLIALGGIGLNAAFGWWWADPVAALGMTVFLIREGREAWEGEDSCGCSSAAAGGGSR
jgi:divalent metal cation (Fe/Co/Zn/Cd) transporter